MRSTCAVVAMGLTLLSVQAAGEPPGKLNSADKLASVADDDTYALVRIDAKSLDVDAAVRAVWAVAPAVPYEFSDGVARLKQALTAFRAAGGDEVILAFSSPELPRLSLLAVPLRQGAPTEALQRLVRSMVDPNWRIETRGRELLAGPPEALTRLRRAGKTLRPAVTAACASSEGAAVQVLLVPQEDHRRVLREVVPLLAGWNNRPMQRLVTGVRWASVGLTTTPKLSLKLAVATTEGAAATSLADEVVTGLDALGGLQLLGAPKPLREQYPQEFGVLRRVLTPAVEGDRLTVRIADGPDLQALGTIASVVEDHFGGLNQSVSGINMKRLLLALHHYQEANGHRLPPAAIRSRDGKPLLSWRVAVLPYLGEEALYRQFNLNEPWDGPHNKALIERMPPVFRSPRVKDRPAGVTTYLAPVGKDAAFTGGPEGRRFPADFEDGLSNTILLVDSADDRGVTWTKPDDFALDSAEPMKGLLGHYAGYCLVGMGDGTLHRVAATVSKATLRAAFTPSGAETLGQDW